MTENEALRNAFEKQCRHADPAVVFMAWQMSGDLPTDDLIDVMKKNGWTS